MFFRRSGRVLSTLCIAIATALPAWAAGQSSPAPGTYVRARATGTLRVEAESVAKGASASSNPFTLETVGANGHSCRLSGFLTSGVGIVALKASNNTDSTLCTIGFKSNGDGWQVAATTADLCRTFCGVRADFDGRYATEPAACAAATRKATRDAFDKQYKSADYSGAVATLVQLRTRCSEFMDWVENDRARNDIAVSQFHLGQFAQCLATLKLTYAGTLPDNEALKAALPPTDYETYAPVAKATWFNQNLCSQAKR